MNMSVKNPKFFKHLQLFGEVGTVKIGGDVVAPFIFVGYWCENDSDCYCMYNTKM